MNQDEIWAMSLMWESVSFSECSKVTESQAGLLNDRFIVANAQDFFFFYSSNLWGFKNTGISPSQYFLILFPSEDCLNITIVS